jgi:hypothetical protein
MRFINKESKMNNSKKLDHKKFAKGEMVSSIYRGDSYVGKYCRWDSTEDQHLVVFPLGVELYFDDNELEESFSGKAQAISNAKQKKVVKKPVESTKKYELTSETKEINGVVLHRIKALKDFVNRGLQVSKGDLGGWIESEKNLSQENNCWVSGDARVFGYARVFEDARVYGNAWVFGNAWVSKSARVYGYALVSGYAQVSGNALVFGNARVSGYAEVFGNARVSGNAWVSGNARVYEGNITK